MMKDRRSYHTLRIRDTGELCRRSGGEGHGVGEGDEDQGQCDKTPAVVADVIEFEVVGGEVELGRGAEPCDASVVAQELELK
jgi:hypothetical protein